MKTVVTVFGLPRSVATVKRKQPPTGETLTEQAMSARGESRANGRRWIRRPMRLRRDN